MREVTEVSEGKVRCEEAIDLGEEERTEGGNQGGRERERRGKL